MLKKCYKCKIEKDITEFYKNNIYSSDGYQGYCKSCSYKKKGYNKNSGNYLNRIFYKKYNYIKNISLHFYRQALKIYLDKKDFNYVNQYLIGKKISIPEKNDVDMN